MTDDEKNPSSAQSSEPSGSSEEGADVGISDDQLPDDLQPTDDNPLAKPPSDDDEDSGMSLNPNDADGAGMGA